MEPLNDALTDTLTPGSMFSGEKVRGAVTSVFSGMTAGGLNLLGVKMGLSGPTSALLSIYLFGNVFGYALDIVFAKRSFRIKDAVTGAVLDGPVPYSALGTRLRWLARSFVRKQFFRFCVTVLLDTLIGLSLIRAIIDYANANDVLTDWSLRDGAIGAGVAIFTFFLYNNILRFDWAYNDNEDKLMNMVALMWTAVVLIVYASTYKPRKDPLTEPGPTSAGLVPLAAAAAAAAAPKADVAADAAQEQHEQPPEEAARDDADAGGTAMGMPLTMAAMA